MFDAHAKPALLMSCKVGAPSAFRARKARREIRRRQRREAWSPRRARGRPLAWRRGLARGRAGGALEWSTIWSRRRRFDEVSPVHYPDEIGPNVVFVSRSSS